MAYSIERGIESWLGRYFGLEISGQNVYASMIPYIYNTNLATKKCSYDSVVNRVIATTTL